MQKINLHNYEAFLLDYLDGTINEANLQELKTFALLYPELNIDLDSEPLPTFYFKDEPFEKKTDLLKTPEDVYDEDLLNYLEGNLIGEEIIKFELKLSLNPVLKRELEAYKKTDLKIIQENIKYNPHYLLKTDDDLILNNVALNYFEKVIPTTTEIENEIKSNPTLQKDILLLQKTKLPVDYSITYQNKEELKKETKVIVLFNFKTVIAIAASLLLIISLSVVFNFNLTKKTQTNFALLQKNKHNYSISKNQTKNSVSIKKVKNNPPSNLIAKNNHYPKQHPKNNQTKRTFQSNTASTKNLVTTNFSIQDTASSVNHLSNNTPVEVNVASSNNITIMNSLASITTQTILTVYEYEEEELEEVNSMPQYIAPKKYNFWKRAVKISKQLNSLGLKAINGNEKSSTNYVLAFNSISIEKK